MERTLLITREPIVRTTWVALCALALGGERFVAPSLLYTALQAAFSAMVLGALASSRSQDLTLDLCSLPVRSDPGPGGTQEAKDHCGWRAEAKLGLAALSTWRKQPRVVRRVLGIRARRV
jgi:hypothetical protein